MAVAMFMSWPGVTSDQYDAMMARLELDANPAAGGVFHLSALTDDGLEVCEVWQTEQAFHGFGTQRFEVIASGAPLKSLKEGADLHARPLESGLGKLAVLPKVLHVWLKKPAVWLLDQSRLDRFANPDLDEVGEKPLEGCPSRGSRRGCADAEVLDVSVAEGIDERLGKALTSR